MFPANPPPNSRFLQFNDLMRLATLPEQVMQLISEFMSEDHANLDRLFEEFEQQRNDDLDRAKLPFDEFMARLQRHIIWEEEFLFPIFEKRTGMIDAGPTAVMRMEHELIKGLLEEINVRVLQGSPEGLDELTVELLEVLGSHNQKEENILYPSLDRMVTDEDREKVLRDLANVSPTQH